MADKTKRILIQTEEVI